MEDLLIELGIDQVPLKSEDNTYVIDLLNSNSYAKMYSTLDRTDLLEEDSESSQVTETVSSIQFVNDDFIFTLLADFDNDIYRLTIREN